MGGSKLNCKKNNQSLNLRIFCANLQDWKVLWSQLTYYEIHLTAIGIGKDEYPQNRAVGDFVIESFSVQLQKGRVDFDVVAPSRCHGWDFAQREQGITSRLNNVRLFEYVLVKRLKIK
jgi:hypothetical protein